MDFPTALDSFLEEQANQGLPDEMQSHEFTPYYVPPPNSRAAFYGSVRDQIAERAQGRSELCGHRDLPDMPLERSHINHDKTASYYNHAENGLMVTIIEHYAYHEMHRKKAWTIGLREDENDWAVTQVFNRCVDWCEAHNVEPLEFRRVVAQAKSAWRRYLNTQDNLAIEA